MFYPKIEQQKISENIQSETLKPEKEIVHSASNIILHEHETILSRSYLKE